MPTGSVVYGCGGHPGALGVSPHNAEASAIGMPRSRGDPDPENTPGSVGRTGFPNQFRTGIIA